MGWSWGTFKLVPKGYGTWKLQIQCVVDNKVGTNLLEEEITKYIHEWVLSALEEENSRSCSPSKVSDCTDCILLSV
ncbi:hypothetical protein P7K49_010635 [Saguinus oedipus]|uniref:Translation elongation factor EF1B beta/delta subunit guanine nucleotide exchange domain-containing protein n=1 Tax=Saguinus oedipus TaxID=9490 RepID=A0ABQ9VPR4_SAGOE|nr:hypothetical protein P7K49_010635 [Saguinus oedipus]